MEPFSRDIHLIKQQQQPVNKQEMLTRKINLIGRDLIKLPFWNNVVTSIILWPLVTLVAKGHNQVWRPQAEHGGLRPSMAASGRE